MVLDRNIFRPGVGAPLSIHLKALENGRVTVRIFNVAGENVRAPFDSDVAGGAWFQANWDGTNDQGQNVAAGVYIVSVKGAGLKSLKKVVVMR